MEAASDLDNALSCGDINWILRESPPQWDWAGRPPDPTTPPSSLCSDENANNQISLADSPNSAPLLPS